MSSDILHRIFGDNGMDAPADEQAKSVAMTPEFMGRLALVYKEMDNLQVTCTKSAPGNIFEAGRKYGLCSVSGDGACLVREKNSHMSLPAEVLQEFFEIQLTPSQLEAIEYLAKDAETVKLETLRGLVKTFLDKSEGTLSVGDVVGWKPGMCNCRRPRADEQGIVLEVLDHPVRSTDPNTAEAGARNDIVVGVLGDDGAGLQHFLMDSRRFRKIEG